MITLASDFGSPYPAAVKGTIRRRTDAELIDVSHELSRGDVRGAAFWLRFALPEFPPAVHFAVVDPGVGTDRAPVVVRAGEHALVGPDNGSLLPPARALCERQSLPPDGFEAFEIRTDDPDSATFHGRDVFAPAAAAVHEAGVDALAGLERLSGPIDPVDFALPGHDVRARDAAGRPAVVGGEVLVVDGFGNAITSVPGSVLDGRERVAVNGTRAPVAETFADVDPGGRLVTAGSHGNVECDVRDARGSAAFELAPGDRVEFAFDP